MSEKFNRQAISHNYQFYPYHHYPYRPIPNDFMDFPTLDYDQIDEKRVFTPTILQRFRGISDKGILLNNRYESSGTYCPHDRPCITAVYNERANLIIEWKDTETRDHYNFRWSRPGKPARQIELGGGRGGKFTLRNFRGNTRYTFSVQGCHKPFIGSSTCTPWYDLTVTSCGAITNPCF